MRSRHRTPLVVFCIAAAITAAAVVDPLVERLSNAGLFGPGLLTDHSNLDVIPALGVGAALSLVFVIGLVRRMLARACYAPRWLRLSSRALDRTTLLRLLPVIYAAQIGCVFAMETAEQVMVAGHPLGGCVWLGGPAAVSLLLHAVGCVVLTAILSRTLHWSARTLVDAVIFVCRLIFGCLPAPAPAALRAFRAAISRPLQDALERLTGCAPPCLSI